MTDRRDEPKKTLSNLESVPHPDGLQRSGDAGPLDLTLFTLAAAAATLLTLTTILMQVI